MLPTVKTRKTKFLTSCKSLLALSEKFIEQNNGKTKVGDRYVVHDFLQMIFNDGKTLSLLYLLISLCKEPCSTFHFRGSCSLLWRRCS